MAPTKKAPAKKTAAKKTAAKKSAAKKTTAKAPAKRAPAKKTAAKKAPAKKTAARKTAAKKAPAKKTATKKTPGTAQVKAITDAAQDLERDLGKAVRNELDRLRKMFDSIQRDVQSAFRQIEKALDPKKIASAAKKSSPKR